jgi:peroxiredoxin
MSKSIAVALMATIVTACAPEPAPSFPTQPVASDPQSEAETQGRPIGDPGPGPNSGRLVPATGERTEFAEKAPRGTFVTDDGRKVEMSELVASEGAVLIFYRGHWCKPCRKQLKEMEGIREELAGRGFKLYAISVDDPPTSTELKKRLSLGFTLLSDKGGMSITQWGVYTREHELARPAVFIITPGGGIAYRFVSDNPIDRPSPETILKEISRLGHPE